MEEQTRQIEKLAQDWAAAELRGDTAVLERALADDFVGVGPRGFMLNKEEWLERHESGKLKYESFGLDEVGVRPYGDTTVIVCRETAEGVYEDENGSYDIHEQFRATLIFVKQQGGWLLASLQLSSIAGRPRAKEETMTHVIGRDELPHGGTAHKFEGYRYGDTNVSFFLTDAPPGTGPALHKHPYAEVFVIQEGDVTFTVGDDIIEATGGQIVVVPAGVPHKFVNSGTGRARHIDIHTSLRMITEWLAG